MLVMYIQTVTSSFYGFRCEALQVLVFDETGNETECRYKHYPMKLKILLHSW
jgi:hypothetical protein